MTEAQYVTLHTPDWSEQIMISVLDATTYFVTIRNMFVDSVKTELVIPVHQAAKFPGTLQRLNEFIRLAKEHNVPPSPDKPPPRHEKLKHTFEQWEEDFWKIDTQYFLMANVALLFVTDYLQFTHLQVMLTNMVGRDFCPLSAPAILKHFNDHCMPHSLDPFREEQIEEIRNDQKFSWIRKKV